MKGVIRKILRNNVGLGGKPRVDKGGYFFITDEDGNERFAHARDIGQENYAKIQEGDQVEFDPIVDTSGRGNGLKATHVVVV